VVLDLEFHDMGEGNETVMDAWQERQHRHHFCGEHGNAVGGTPLEVSSATGPWEGRGAGYELGGVRRDARKEGVRKEVVIDSAV
jgi:hypothetical protein